MHTEGSFMWPGCSSDRIMVLMTPKPAVERSLESAADTDREREEEIQHAGGIQPNYDVGVHADVTIKPAAAGAPFLPYGPKPGCLNNPFT